jgi:hypothetical protein
MKEVMGEYLRSSGLAVQLKHPALFRAWERVAPEPFRALARLAGFKNKVVIVEVASSAVLWELKQFWKDQIRQALIREMNGRHIADVRFIVADFRSGNEPNTSL